jgi:hypothetical protein
VSTFSLTFKSPDVLDYLQVEPEQRDRALEFARRFIKFDEYVTIDFDTDSETVQVREVKR